MDLWLIQILIVFFIIILLFLFFLYQNSGVPINVVIYELLRH